jgi:hypothetical protein
MSYVFWGSRKSISIGHPNTSTCQSTVTYCTKQSFNVQTVHGYYWPTPYSFKISLTKLNAYWRGLRVDAQRLSQSISCQYLQSNMTTSCSHQTRASCRILWSNISHNPCQYDDAVHALVVSVSSHSGRCLSCFRAFENTERLCHYSGKRRYSGVDVKCLVTEARNL